MNVILQRQGWGKTLRTNGNKLLTPGAGNDRLPFHAEINDWQDKGWFVEITHGEDRYTLPHANLDCPRELYASVKTAKKALADKLTELMGQPVTVDERTEAYFIRRDTDKTSYPYVMADVEFQRARYEERTNTIRSVPENYCLISWPNGDINAPVFNVDAATDEGEDVHPSCRWRSVCAKAHDCFLQTVNQSYGPVDSKRWLAWLITEWRKYGMAS